jgi:hypothetical protein
MSGLKPFETAEGAEYHGCRQLNIFLENRLGQLLRITRLLEAEPIRILGLSVEGKVDCAIVRMLVDDPDAADRMCSEAGFACTESEVLVVELPAGKRAIMTVCAALISAEVNINYVYTAWARDEQNPSLVIQVDNLPQAMRVLAHKGFAMLAQDEL